MKITELPNIEEPKSSNYLIVHDGVSTKKITLEQIQNLVNTEVLKRMEAIEEDLEKLNALGLSVDSEGYIVQEVEDE